MSTVACSSGFIYKNLDWVIPWYVDDYVELNEEQKAEFTMIVDEALVWHKQQELPRYHQYLQTVYDKLDGTLSEDDISHIQAFTRSSFTSLQRYIVPMLVPLSTTLDTEQRQDFWANLNNKQVEYEEEFLPRSDEEYVDDLGEKYTEFAEKLLGTLTEEQALVIKNGVGTVIRADAVWLKARQAWLDNVKRQYDGALDETRQQEVTKTEWIARIESAWLDRDQHYSADEALKIDERDGQARQLLLAVINSRTENQTDHFKQFIQDWQGKLTRWQR